MKWVTRANANVDRVACPWLIKRFVDPDAEFLFVEEFAVPIQALWWGPALGMMTALVGSFAPAWSVRTVKSAEVFARVIG